MISALLLAALAQELLHEGFEGETLRSGIHPGWSLDASDGRAEVAESGAAAGRRALRLLCTDRAVGVRRTEPLGISPGEWRMSAKARLAAGPRHRLVLLLRWLDANGAPLAEDVSAPATASAWTDLSMTVPRPPTGARQVVPAVRLEGEPGDAEALVDEIRVGRSTSIRLKALDRTFLVFSPGESVRIAVEGAGEARLFLADPDGEPVRAAVRESPGPVFDVGPLARGAWRAEVRSYSGGRETARTRAWVLVAPAIERGSARGVLLRPAQPMPVDPVALLDAVGASSVGVALDDPGRPGRHPMPDLGDFTAPLVRRLETELVGVRSRSEDFSPGPAHRVFDRWQMPPSEGLQVRLRRAGCSGRMGPELELIDASDLVDASGHLTASGVLARALNASCRGAGRTEERGSLHLERFDSATVLRATGGPVVYVVPEAATVWDPFRAPRRVEAGATLTVGPRPLIILR